MDSGAYQIRNALVMVGLMAVAVAGSSRARIDWDSVKCLLPGEVFSVQSAVFNRTGTGSPTLLEESDVEEDGSEQEAAGEPR